MRRGRRIQAHVDDIEEVGVLGPQRGVGDRGAVGPMWLDDDPDARHALDGLVAFCGGEVLPSDGGEAGDVVRRPPLAGWDGTIRLASPEAEADGRGPAAARLPRRRGDVEGRRALGERLARASPARDAHDGPVGQGGGLVPSVGVAGEALALDLIGGQARETRDELADDARDDLGIRQDRIRRLIVAVPPGGRPRVLAPDNPCKLTWYFDAHIRTLPTRLSKAHRDEWHAPSSESALDSACQANDMYLLADYDRQIEYEGYEGYAPTTDGTTCSFERIIVTLCHIPLMGQTNNRVKETGFHTLAFR